MSWYGSHPKISAEAARMLLPARACRLCVYRKRCFPTDIRRPCTRCGSDEAEHIKAKLYPTIDAVVDSLFDVRAKIFEHVGYVEQWRDMPFEDSRSNYWAIDDYGRVKFSPSREALTYWLEEHDDEYGPHSDKLYVNEIFSGRHDAGRGIHRGAELTMICVDTMTDGNMFFQLFRNDHEVKLAEPSDDLHTESSVVEMSPPPPVVYVRATTGSDETGDGTTVETAYQTVMRAMRDVVSRGPNCVIDTDGAGEVGRRFTVRQG